MCWDRKCMLVIQCSYDILSLNPMHIGSDAGLVKEKVKSHGHYLMSALQVVGLKKLSNKK